MVLILSITKPFSSFQNWSVDYREVKETEEKTSKTAGEEIAHSDPCLRLSMLYLACCLLQQLGFVPGTNAYPFLIYLWFELRSCKKDKLFVMPCVCVLEQEEVGTWLGSWLDLPPAQQHCSSQPFIRSLRLNFSDKTECKEYVRKRKGELIDPIHSATTPLCFFY